MKLTIAERLTNKKEKYLKCALPKRLDRITARENLLLIHKVFTQASVVFWLMYGTLLGAIREDDFIKYDTDIDLGFYKNELESVFQVLLRLRKYGFEIVRTDCDDDVLTLLRKNISIDFYGVTQQTKGWTWGAKWERKDYFSKLETREFLGVVFSQPTHLLEFLEEHYGKNWKTPQKNKQAFFHGKNV